MLGVSVVTPQCLTVGKAGLATHHTSLTALFAFCCSHPAELQQPQQWRCRGGRLNGSASEMQPSLHMRIICIQLQSCENVLVFNLCKKDL